MTGTSDQVAEATPPAGRVSRREDTLHAASGSRSGFLEWVTRLAHTHRRRLYRLARREGLREDDSFDCVQDALQTFILLPRARQLVESNDDSIKPLSVLVRNHARKRRRRHEIASPHDSGDETLVLARRAVQSTAGLRRTRRAYGWARTHASSPASPSRSPRSIRPRKSPAIGPSHHGNSNA